MNVKKSRADANTITGNFKYHKTLTGTQKVYCCWPGLKVMKTGTNVLKKRSVDPGVVGKVETSKSVTHIWGYISDKI